MKGLSLDGNGLVKGLYTVNGLVKQLSLDGPVME